MACQQVITRNNGFRRQYLCDDKGTVLIVIFGVPPFSQETDVYRAVKTALEIRQALMKLNVGHSQGVATGDVYVGSVGSALRREHAVVGDTVNASARLSGRAENYGILCDFHTYEGCRSTIKMRAEGSIKVCDSCLE